MQPLPKGYYAVIPMPRGEYDLQADSFTYKGVTYAGQVGENLFSTVAAAVEKATEVPDTVLPGLDYDGFDTPVVLLGPGVHHIAHKSYKEQVVIDRSVVILGAKACVDPNCKGIDPLAPPTLSPERTELAEESYLRGGYDRGAIAVRGEAVSKVIVDGVTTAECCRFADFRSAPSCDVVLTFRNIRHNSPCGHSLYSFSTLQHEHPYQREVIWENIFLEDDFSDCGYGGSFCFLNVNKASVRNLRVNGTTQVFGFSTINRSFNTCPVNGAGSEILIEDSYLGNLRGERGLQTTAYSGEGRGVVLSLKNTVLHDASREGESPLQPHLANAHCALHLTNCHLRDTRGGVGAISYRGDFENITIENTVFEGFTAPVERAAPPPTKAPLEIENHSKAWMSNAADPHTVIGTNGASFAALDAHYAGCKPYYGDLHTHSNAGGTSDGKTPLGDWVAGMDALGMDFAVMVDHRQMRGYFLPEWSEERFVYGTEPGTRITDLQDKAATMDWMHYNMIFPHKYGLAMVLANFPEFAFRGDELTGHFDYPKFTLERIREIAAYVRSIGGCMVHAHPKSLLASREPLDYYLGEWSYLETLVGTYRSHPSFKSYDLWVELLQAGKHVYTSAGSDTHGAVSNGCPSTFYTQKRFHADFLERMRAGDFAAGGVGIQMMIDGAPMGSQIAYREGMSLTLRVGDFHAATWQKNTAYELQIWTDEGLAYASMFNGKEPQELSLEVQKRKYYRVVIEDLTHKYRVCISNPIWLDKEEI